MHKNIYIKFLSFLLLIISSLTIRAQENCFELVWSDEFNYSGFPDSSRWSYEVGNNGWGNNELQYYTEKRLENARVVDSVLIIEAHKEDFEGSQYTSARLITYKNNLSWKYGKIEARMKLPYGQGIWPAFWMLGNGIFEGTGWPACGEIDIMELIGGGEGRDDVSHGTIHWADANNNHAMYGGSYQLTQGIFADAFHLFTIEWNESTIKWFIDGLQFHVVDITPGSLSEFHQNFFLLLNIAVGGNWPGNPNTATVFPQQMVIDYVRVYQLNAIPEISGKKKIIKAESNVFFETIESDEFDYQWIVPDDAQILSGQGTNKINVNWGCTPGNVTCELTTMCQTHNLLFPVELEKLTISGKTLVTENEKNIIYTVPQAIQTTYDWTLPEMVSSTINLNSNSIDVKWGTKDGLLKVSTENFCGQDSAELYVSILRQLPYPDISQPHLIPGIVQTVNYDIGGEGIAYHDKDAENQGPGIRQNEGVDTENNDGGGNVGWIEAGEWLEYTISCQQTNLYDIEIRVASPNSNVGKFKLSFNGEDRTGTVSVPLTGSWSSFSSIFIKEVEIRETDTLMRIDMLANGFNMGKLIFADSIPNSVISNSGNYGLTVYPTVATTEITVKNCGKTASYFIFDATGLVITGGNFTNSDIVDISQLSNGAYIISIHTEDFSVSKRFIKTN